MNIRPQKRTEKNTRPFLNLSTAALILTGMYSALATQAKSHEVFHIKELHAEKGKVGFEYMGASFHKHPKEEEHEEHEEEEHNHEHVLKHAHEAGLFLGVTDWWRAGVTAAFEKPEDEKFDFSEIALENVFVLAPGHGGFGFGLTVTLARSLETYDTEMQLGTIATFESGPWSGALENGFGRVLTSGTAWDYSYGARLRYALDDHWGFGVEAFGTIEDIAHAPSFSDQEHRLGPVLYWKSHDHGEEQGHHDEHDKHGLENEEEHGPGMHTELGLLFGLTDATNDITVKWGVGIEF